ncbi:MAG: tryptophan synthase subunit alpha [Armatimonadia bacterium]|nr:tryptophan synthase subunit alpha [Armatimonadia bacterium]
MRTRIADRFARLKEAGEGALITYVAAGDPSLDETVDIVLAMEDAGVDIVELGMPFSDPVADGPTIQAACQRAIAAGATPTAVLRTVERIRRRSEMPIVIMTYLNLIHHAGYKRFACDAADAGVDGMLISDLPVGAAHQWLRECRACDVDTVFLVAPTSGEDTLQKVGEATTGFVYCVSRAGTTGARSDLPEDLPDFVQRVRGHASHPVCVGFGISTPEQVRAVCRTADGAVIGSALIDRMSDAGPKGAAKAAGEFCAQLKAGTRRDA